MDLQNISKRVLGTLSKHAPEILTGLGVAGVVVTAVLTAKATLKVDEVLKEENLTPKEKVKEVWKDYIPPVVSAVATGACIIAGNRIQAKRTAAFAFAAESATLALASYKNKVAEVLGEKAEEKVADAVMKQKIDDHPVMNIESTGKGTQRFYDDISGRYFIHDPDTVRHTVNKLNQRLLTEMYITVNELYYELNLPPIKLGDQLGWNIENGLIELRNANKFRAFECDDGTPAFIMEFVNDPTANYK